MSAGIIEQITRDEGLLTPIAAADHDGGKDVRLHAMCSVFFFSSRRRHTRLQGDWSSDVCSSDLLFVIDAIGSGAADLVIDDDGFVGAIGAANGESGGVGGNGSGVRRLAGDWIGGDGRGAGGGRRGDFGGGGVFKKKKRGETRRTG